MNWFQKAAKMAFLTATAGALFFSTQAGAQTQPTTKTTSPEPKETVSDPGWHASITPYMWFSGLAGTTGVLRHDASVHADFGDIFSALNIGALVAGEVRHDRIVMPVDFIWMKLSKDKVPAIQPFDTETTIFKAKMTETIVTPKIGYRVVDGKRVKIDALLGFRYWHLSSSLSVQPPIEGGYYADSANWVDAVGGGRIEAGLTPKLFLVVAGDAGGGTARSDYQIAGLLGYKISHRWDLLAGYRYLSVNYRPNGHAQFVYDVNMPGLVLGATYRIK
jgi:hypothetical protein